MEEEIDIDKWRQIIYQETGQYVRQFNTVRTVIVAFLIPLGTGVIFKEYSPDKGNFSYWLQTGIVTLSIAPIVSIFFSVLIRKRIEYQKAVGEWFKDPKKNPYPKFNAAPFCQIFCGVFFDLTNWLCIFLVCAILIISCNISNETKPTHVNVSGSLQLQPPITVTHPSVTAGGFLDTLANMALKALETAAKKTKDESSLASEAANEFVKSFSRKAGEATVKLFDELIKAGFSGDNKDMSEEKKEKLFAIIFHGITKDTCMLSESHLIKQNILKEQVLFSTNKANLSDSAESVIEKILSFIHSHPNSILLLSSNTDTTGSNKINIRLSKQRNNTVRDALISQGDIKSNRIISLDLVTQSLPVFTKKNSDEPRNRSVTIEAIDWENILGQTLWYPHKSCLFQGFEIASQRHLSDLPVVIRQYE